MFNNYGIKVAKIFKRAEALRFNLKHPYVGSEHLLLAILENDNYVSSYLKKYSLTFDVFKKELLSILKPSKNINSVPLYTPLLKRIILSANNIAQENNEKMVNEKHLFLAILEEGEGIALRILVTIGIDLDKIYDDLKINLLTKKTDKLDCLELGVNLVEKIDCKECIINREEEVSAIIEVLLRKKKSNPLLIGKAGVGKTAIVEELARRIKKNLVPLELRNKIILSLDMASLVSGTKYRGEFEEKLTKIINEVKDNNIILFIDEIHTMINAGGAEGAINASDILKPYLARGEIKVIGSTTLDEYYKTIHTDKALDRRFFAITINEPTLCQTKEILYGIKNEYEKFYHLNITNKNIDDLVLLCDKYIKNKNNPDKSIDMLEMVCAHKKAQKLSFSALEKLDKNLKTIIKKKELAIKNNDYDKAIFLKEKETEINTKKNNIVNEENNGIKKEDILEVLAKKTNIPLLEDKKMILTNIRENLEKNIIGQNEAINRILKDIWFKLNNDSKPLSLFLNGPSGVGKTECVKQIASSIKNINFIRLDMSEYNLDTSVNKLIGVSAGYVGYDDAYIFRSLLDNPYAIILIDEIEKAHPRVLNLFLQILDEGFITNSRGEKIDFSNTMIFATSNVLNSKSLGFTNNVKNDLNEFFSKEFLGRFLDVITFKNLSDEVLKEYTKKNLTNKNVSFASLRNEALCDTYGLRNLKNLIKKYNCEIDIEIPI